MDILIYYIFQLAFLYLIYRVVKFLVSAIYRSIKTSLRTVNAENKPSTPVVTIDDIIVYKEENGVVNAYFNQQALDVYLFERAKVKSNNFSTKEKWERERGKRAVKLEDLNNTDHAVWSYALSDNEFASEGNLILVIGLDHIMFSNYCHDNNISEVDTLLYCGVNIYSKYSGEITTYIRHRYIGRVDLKNKIQDGDLLFSIKLSTPTEKIVKPHESVTFSYNLLSRDFLDAVPYITDITLGKCLVENNSYVNKGDEVIEVVEYTNSVFKYEPRYRTTIKSPYSGLIVFTNDDLKYQCIRHKLKKGTTLFDIYQKGETIEETIKDRHPNEISVSIDSYTNITTISSTKCAGRYYGFRMENAYIAFENTAGKTYLLLRHDRKLLQLNKKCSLHLYLSDKTIITITPEVNPTRYNDSYFEARFYIPSEAMKKT